MRFPRLFPSILLTTPEGRRAAAFLALIAGCAVMTIYASVVLYIVADDHKLAFYLGLAAHLHILLGLTALAGLLIKRSFKATRSGIEITDSVTEEVVQQKANELKEVVQQKADETKEELKP